MQRCMPSRPSLLAAATFAATVLAVGCNGPTPADVFLVQRTGTIPGAKATLRFIDDGHVSCNGGPATPISSAQLITAREIRRELDGQRDEDVGLAEKHINLPPGRVTSLSYRVRSQNGTVAFSDTSAHQPQAFYRLAQLTREVAKGPCGLPR
jgi:hypothetical protein